MTMKQNGHDTMEEGELLASNLTLVTHIWHLLHAHNLMTDGKYTFPNGEVWTEEDFTEFAAHWDVLNDRPV